MHDYPDLPRFFIRLALVGSPPEVFRQVVPELQEELDQRVHLQHPKAMWDPEQGRVVVAAEDIGRDPQQAADGMVEELWEILSGVLDDDIEEFRIDILSTSPVECANDPH